MPQGKREKGRERKERREGKGEKGRERREGRGSEGKEKEVKERMGNMIED